MPALIISRPASFTVPGVCLSADDVHMPALIPVNGLAIEREALEFFSFSELRHFDPFISVETGNMGRAF